MNADIIISIIAVCILLPIIAIYGMKYKLDLFDNIRSAGKKCNDCPYYNYYMEHKKDSE